MDARHRDRIAFLRICSGEFEPGMNAFHVRLGKSIKINQAVQFMSRERTTVDKAYAGDIIGIHDKTLMIGDTLSQGEAIQFTGVPQFSPDLFARVLVKDPLRAKQLVKGLEQLSEEGTSQTFHRKHTSEHILGVVGRLQFEVVKYRLLNEYGAESIFENLPYTMSRWVHHTDSKKMNEFLRFYHEQVVYDARGYPVILFKSDWERLYIEGKNEGFRFYASLMARENDFLGEAA
jgi:peptide chain release factor 3